MARKLSQWLPGLAKDAVNADLGGHGSTGSPSYCKLVSVDGTAYYLFVSNTGVLRISATEPTANTDGYPVA